MLGCPDLVQEGIFEYDLLGISPDRALAHLFPSIIKHT